MPTILKAFIISHLIVSILILLLATPDAGLLLVLVVFPLWMLVESGIFIGFIAYITTYKNIKAPINLWLALFITIFILYVQLTS